MPRRERRLREEARRIDLDEAIVDAVSAARMKAGMGSLSEDDLKGPTTTALKKAPPYILARLGQPGRLAQNLRSGRYGFAGHTADELGHAVALEIPKGLGANADRHSTAIDDATELKRFAEQQGYDWYARGDTKRIAHLGKVSIRTVQRYRGLLRPAPPRT